VSGWAQIRRIVSAYPQRTRAFVSWSAGWTGGTITYKLRNGRWIGKTGAQWITQEPRRRAAVAPG